MKFYRRMRRYIRNAIYRIPNQLDPNTVDMVDAQRWFNANLARETNELVKSVIPYINPAGVIIDVGANTGHFSWHLLNALSFSGRAFLFEPVPNLAHLCRERFGPGRFNVEVRNLALGDEDGEIKIYTPPDGNIGWNSVYKPKRTPNALGQPVKIARADHQNLPDPDFIKIDVEGFEHRVVNGFLPLLKRQKHLPLLLIEVVDPSRHQEPEAYLSAFQALQGLGYKTKSMDGTGVEIKGVTKTMNLLFSPT